MSGDTDWRDRLSSLTVPLSVSENPFLSTCLDRILRIGRLYHDEGVALMHESICIRVKWLTEMIKQAKLKSEVSYNRNLHVNTTNICVLAC